MKKLSIAALFACITVLVGCSDPKANAEKLVKEGCMTTFPDKSTADSFCGCIASNLIKNLNDSEIKLLNKQMDNMTIQEQKVVESIIEKIDPQTIQACLK